MITLAEAKLQLNIDATDTTHDTEIQSFIDATDEIVERHTNRVGSQRAVVERHLVANSRRLLLYKRPVVSLTSVEQLDPNVSTTYTVADIDVDPDTGKLRVLDGDNFDGLLKITYQAGHATVPDNFKMAARIIVQHLWSTQRGSSGVQVGGGTLGDSLTNTAGGGRGYAIPNAALQLLGEPGDVWVG